MLRPLIALLVCGTAAAAAPPTYRFPKDPHVLDAKADLGAKGDGKTDDTAALQKGIDLSCGRDQKVTKVLFLPNGTYRLTKSLVVNHALGPWLYGETRDGVVLKLDDGVQGVTAVLRTHPNEKPPTSADWFMRNLRNFTVDAGKNPDTDGVRYYATNTGILQNVRVIGAGKVGINSGFLDQNGPCLVQDCTVEGFETGVLSQWNWGQTLSRLTIKNCRKNGLVTAANVVAAEDLVVEKTPRPVHVQLPNDWYWWGGVLALRGATITGDFPKEEAIRNDSVLYARNVTTKGYGFAVTSHSVPNRDRGDGEVREYASGDANALFAGAPKDAGLNLPVEREPVVPWELDPTKWVCANHFGAAAGDNKDDTAAIQAAIDAAAKSGATVVTLRGCGGFDPNWYTLDGEVKVRGSVRLVLGLGFGRIIKGKAGRFVVDDDSAPVVKFQNLDALGGPPVEVENRSAKNTLVVESCGVKVVGTGTGKIFVTDVSGPMDLRKPGQKVWCRQFNPEGDSDDGLVKNAGADLWVLGFKTEGKGVRVATSAGGRTEILGAFVYGSGCAKGDTRPIFDVADASLSVQGLREITFAGDMYAVKVREARGGETRTFGTKPGHGWIGWPLYTTPTK